MNKREVRYYTDFDYDFFDDGKEHKLPNDYCWIRKDFRSKLLSALIYSAAVLFANTYCRFFQHVHIVGAKKLRRQKGGFFLYGNHTQPVGDVFNPARCCFPKRIYTVVSAANMDLPVIGKILPFLGALPLPQSIAGMRSFNSAVSERVKTGHPVIIYPEAHQWEYYTDIRPFTEASFKYPVKLDAPVYCMTTTYQKRKWGKKPKITIFIDGPFTTKAENTRQKATELRDAVRTQMKNRSKASNYAYIVYKQKTESQD